MLLKRRSAKRATTADGSIDGARRLALILHGHMDACTNCRAVRLYADQLYRDPVVAVFRGLKDAEGMGIAGSRATNGNEKVLETVVAEVGEGYAVPFV